MKLRPEIPPQLWANQLAHGWANGGNPKISELERLIAAAILHERFCCAMEAKKALSPNAAERAIMARPDTPGITSPQALISTLRIAEKG